MEKIYLVEDEKNLSTLLISYLEEEGYKVTPFFDGLEARNHIMDAPDLWILDIMLPGLDGYSLIKEIKGLTPDIPVIFMSARNAELDRVVGLEMGSDDYLPKPFLPKELVLRVKRILRTATISNTNEAIVRIGAVEFNPIMRVVKKQGNDISLTLKEYDLLAFFIKEINKAVSRDEILDKVWGTDYFGSEKVIDDTLRRLRKKLPGLPIEAVYGFGYILKQN